MDIVYHLKKMEEVLRTASRHQTLNGSVIMLPEDTAQLWRNVVLEILAAAQHGVQPTAYATRRDAPVTAMIQRWRHWRFCYLRNSVR